MEDMKELWRIFWVESGWAQLTWKQRAIATYVCLSLLACLGLAEPSNILVVFGIVANLGVSVALARRAKFPDMEE